MHGAMCESEHKHIIIVPIKMATWARLGLYEYTLITKFSIHETIKQVRYINKL